MLALTCADNGRHSHMLLSTRTNKNVVKKTWPDRKYYKI